MIAAIKAEFRKLLTIRSTYVITLLATLLIGFIAFWGMGWKGGPTIPPVGLHNAALNLISVMGIFSGIIAILLITHEYRYNTIAYTLTSSNSRMKVLLAKMFVMTTFSIVVTIFTVAISVGLVVLGAKMNDVTILPQQFELYSVAWRTLVYMVMGSLAGLAIGFLSRSVVFAIVAYFAFPTTVEPLLHGLLKVSNNYLPFAAQNQIIAPTGALDSNMYSPLASAAVFGAYLLGAWIVATVLFIRRDAN
ncbi:MAG TPA: ABC transporter permease [Candidatus Saccharimonadales bacterium]|nr:ABC transporter permease [Candidatus Saccharimonadales bacterium]